MRTSNNLNQNPSQFLCCEGFAFFVMTFKILNLALYLNPLYKQNIKLLLWKTIKILSLMNQTGLLLASTYGDIFVASNVLTLVHMHTIPVSVEDTMYAYMVTKDWCDWITNQNMPNNPVCGYKGDFLSMLGIFHSLLTGFEQELQAKAHTVMEIFTALNPNLISLLRSPVEGVKANTEMFFRSLRCTADFFAEKLGDNVYHEKLNDKNVPPLKKS